MRNRTFAFGTVASEVRCGAVGVYPLENVSITGIGYLAVSVVLPHLLVIALINRVTLQEHSFWEMHIFKHS